eukprot:scaffold20356_cov125-Isochrysis_galbana.AAC.12
MYGGAAAEGERDQCNLRRRGGRKAAGPRKCVQGAPKRDAEACGMVRSGREWAATFGTVASAYANRSLAPFRMMPSCSCTRPGRKPGTSTKVRIGMLKQSQKRTNRAALMEASMSRHPANSCG